MLQKRDVFLVSDHTGITIEALARSLLSQFADGAFVFHTIPYVINEQDMQTVIKRVDTIVDAGYLPPLVFSTITNPDQRKMLSSCKGLCMDLFSLFMPELEHHLGVTPPPLVGQSHTMNDENYSQRMTALDYALKTDDGGSVDAYDAADIILLGLSRSGKTPVSLYMALQSGLRVANYPLVEDDLERQCLPPALRQYKAKVRALTISAERLHEIREKRLPDSQYASLRQCRKELSCLADICRQASLPVLDVTQMSVEEIATHLLHIN